MRKNAWAWSVSTGQIWRVFLIGLFVRLLFEGSTRRLEPAIIRWVKKLSHASMPARSSASKQK